MTSFIFVISVATKYSETRDHVEVLLAAEMTFKGHFIVSKI